MHRDAKSTETVVADGAPPTVPRSVSLQQYVSESLANAELLLKHAAKTGKEIEAGIREKILRAAAANPAEYDEKMAADLLQALAQLSARLKPVTVESLQVDEKEAKRVFRKYMWSSLALALVILLFSVLSFITTALSKTITDKIDESNQLAATLREELGPTNQPGHDPSQPPAGVNSSDLFNQLQTYASNIRQINSRSKQLNKFILNFASEYYLQQMSTNAATNHTEFQLPVGLPNLWDAEQGRTTVYQHVRSFAQSVVNNVSLYYGAILTCVLPVFYALFGTCAYFLRKYEQQMTAKSFVPSLADSAHFIIAGICGAVVGLFNVTLSQQISVSPLAIAFLVGYGVDVFFSYLESFLQVLKGKG